MAGMVSEWLSSWLQALPLFSLRSHIAALHLVLSLSSPSFLSLSDFFSFPLYPPFLLRERSTCWLSNCKHHSLLSHPFSFTLSPPFPSRWRLTLSLLSLHHAVCVKHTVSASKLSRSSDGKINVETASNAGMKYNMLLIKHQTFLSRQQFGPRRHNYSDSSRLFSDHNLNLVLIYNHLNVYEHFYQRFHNKLTFSHHVMNVDFNPVTTEFLYTYIRSTFNQSASFRGKEK